MGKESNILFIHNYCDRWCERCGFSNRCAVYEAEKEFTDEEKDINNEAFWRNLTNIFVQAKQLLADKAEEFGIELNTINDEKIAEQQKREDEIVAHESLTKLANKYAKEARKILEAKDEWLIFSPLDEESQNEMLSIIIWYQYFISAKIQRGLSGILDFEGNEDSDELNNSQSDANGSVKIGLIAVERSIMAWTALLTKENSSIISPLISLLNKIKQKAETKFPHAQDFIRPGFDEIETVM